MPKSYRIRTEIGKDKSLKVLLDQEFEYLEILSFKILQSQVYTRQCSDYGVVVGRVTVNDGYGVPNAKVSVFIPKDNTDDSNPIVSDLYPYRTVEDLNADGYRYNLLPYRPSYNGHVPTGTFFDRYDVLTNPALIEVYDKYYKYNAVTNDSGDFMIFGVPVGEQTLHVDVDLSDIGEFSLTPRDLIRIGKATEEQVNGVLFKSSNNLSELPQIISINRTIEIEPFWGEPQICNLGITRTDFDLSAEAGIIIKPTATFMGSIFSSIDEEYLKRNCRPTKGVGDLCSLTAGPGRILAIRQTPFLDSDGRPVLEPVELESGGQVIDENGVWSIDVPMNLDYVITNEFGEQVLSDDPNKGIPTNARYRFKIKWNQSTSTDTVVRRGYFLVPNIKEWGWDFYTDPFNSPSTSPEYITLQKNYAFSLDWADYGVIGSTVGDKMIQEAINCEDRFYFMSYNNVYTVSQLIDRFRRGISQKRYVGIKDILNQECAAEINKFPTNDAQYKSDGIYTLFRIVFAILKPIIFILPIILHSFALLVQIIAPIISAIVAIVFGIVIALCKFVDLLVFWKRLNCPDKEDFKNAIKTIWDIPKRFTNIPLNMLTYPECDMCTKEAKQAIIDTNALPEDVQQYYDNPGLSGIYSVLTPFQDDTEFSNGFPVDYANQNSVQAIFAGDGVLRTNPDSLARAPQLNPFDDGKQYIFTSSITIAERLNLFNNKSKYFDETPLNPGGGVNRIKVNFSPTNSSKYHFDNVVALMCVPSVLNELTPGRIITFQSPTLSKDPNLSAYTQNPNAYGTSSITGTTNTNPNFIIEYANQDGVSGTISNSNSTYQIIQTGDTKFARFPIDIEYFQVITAMTYSEYSANCNSVSSAFQKKSLNERFLKNSMCLNIVDNPTRDWTNGNGYAPTASPFYKSPIEIYNKGKEQIVVFLVRGVDPNTDRVDVQYDLSYLYGYDSWGALSNKFVIKGKYKLNYPIRGTLKSLDNGSITTSNNTDSYTTEYMYLPALYFLPAANSQPYGFSGFASNLHTYYSSLGTNISFNPAPALLGDYLPPNLNYFTNKTSSIPLHLKPFTLPLPSYTYNFAPSSFNGFLVEPTSKTVLTNWWGNLTINSTSTNNRGYFPGEIVEGGSVMFQKIQISQFTAQNLKAYAYTYSPKYSSTLIINFPNNLCDGPLPTIRTIMRADRLPTSTTLDVNLENSFCLHNNLGFSIFALTDEGVNITLSNPNNQGPENDPYVTPENNPNFTSTLVESLSECGKMVSLNCYKSNCNSITVLSGSCNECRLFAGYPVPIVQDGAYTIVSVLVVSLLCDILVIIPEWLARFQTIFAACRGVFSHIFVNNWINGTLFAPAFKFKNRRILDAYCSQLILLHNESNNFYYRCAPYYYGNLGQGFWGHSDIQQLSDNQSYISKQLNYPTTLMNLGPRVGFLQEISLTNNFDGYLMNRLSTTSFGDISDILNLFIISRLAAQNWFGTFFNANTLPFFNGRGRYDKWVDGDYAQMISINSEIGVDKFEAENYPDSTTGGQSPVYYCGNARKGVFGIFFESDLQTRDWATPRRNIRDISGATNDSCTFGNIGTFSQEVPFYQWWIMQDPDLPQPSIFGAQSNDWAMYPPIPGSEFMFSQKYQSMDRLLSSSRYFRTNSGPTRQFWYKGYIYSVDTAGNISADISTWDKNPSNLPPYYVPPASLPSNNNGLVTVGAPFHFYFGIRRGRSAFDKFLTQWINTNLENEYQS